MRLDPQTKGLLDEIAAAEGPQYWEMPIDDARAFFNTISADLATPAPGIGSMEDRMIPVPDGEIGVRIYQPTEAARGGVQELPLVLHFHGGGFVLGGLDAYDAVCQNLCERTPAVVVSVDYRLAPEHRFPIAVDDSIVATRWAWAEAAGLGADASCMALVGDSAGGCLVAAVTQALRDDRDINLAYQVLVYPVTDVGTLETASYSKFAEGYLLSKEMMAWFAECYLNSDAEKMDPRVSPLRAERFDGLPPALIITAGFDPLLDEGIAYAKALEGAGVPVQHVNYEHQIHAFWSLGAAIDEAKDALGLAAAAIHDAVA